MIPSILYFSAIEILIGLYSFYRKKLIATLKIKEKSTGHPTCLRANDDLSPSEPSRKEKGAISNVRSLIT